MDLFSEVYDKSRDVLKSQAFDKSWQEITVALKGMFDAGGPNVAKADVLDKLRKQLSDCRRWWQFSQQPITEEILKACLSDEAGFQERAALIKTVKHFYLVCKKGNQSLWVVDSPASYSKWSYGQFKGLSKTALSTQLNQTSEVFGNENRKMMSDSLQLSRKWSSQVEVALSNREEALIRIVKRWFHASDATDEVVDASIVTLLTGFKAIHAACNSGQIIFSDRPHKRASGTYDSVYASVNSRDTMSVIYIFEIFLKTGRRTFFGNIPKLWLCALTVIHELSHKVAHTDDIRYDSDGLKPSVGFSSQKALKNADSWAYF